MKLIEPTHKEIMMDLDCCYYCRWHKGQCECHDPKQFKVCYEEAKKRLTRTELTEEEIRQGQKQNAKSTEAIDNALHEFFD